MTNGLLQPKLPALLLLALCCWYLLATLPYLDRYPIVGRDEPQIAAPAWSLASKGIYGQELFTGYYRSEQYVYEFLPLHPLVLAPTFELLGLGLWQMRLPSVVCGLLTLLLTYALGRQLYGPPLGLLAAAVLGILRLAVVPGESGVPLIDLGRLARYDILVPPLVLAAALVFVEGMGKSELATTGAIRVGAMVVAGVLTGVATLAHVYGAFVLPLFVAMVVWGDGWRALRRPAIYLLAGGWLLVALCWLAYALQDPAAYYGQTLWDQALGRYDLFNPAFYAKSLLTEGERYKTWVGAQGELLLLPRVGIWLLLVGIALAYIDLVRRIRGPGTGDRGPGTGDRETGRPGDRGQRHSSPNPQSPIPNHLSPPQHPTSNIQHPTSPSARFLLLCLLIPGGLLALLVNRKIPNYTLLLLPFLALQAAYGLLWLWGWASSRWGRMGRGGGALLLAAALAESGLSTAAMLREARAASPFMPMMAEVGRIIPAGARVMAIHNLWVGLAQYEARSIDLPFRLSNPNYYKPTPLTMEEAMRQVAPDYLLVDPLIERHIISSIDRNDNPILVAQKQEFARIIAAHCSAAVGRVDDPRYDDYGPLTVYRCGW